MVDRIACFLTCGYTEAGAMQFFLKKINDKFEYKQYLPNKTIKKKGDSKAISKEISGLTGETLIEKVYDIVAKHRAEIAECKAVIIEDDLDGRFLQWTSEQIFQYKNNIIQHIGMILNMDMPVFMLYASPEIESWFITDWENGYGYLYTDGGIVPDVETNVRRLFVHHLKNYISKEILNEYVNNIEKFGCFQEDYSKLSDLLIDAIQCGVKESIALMPDMKSEYKQQILESRHLYYSKKRHGDLMLRNIHPDIVAAKCHHYFAPTYYEIADFE